MKAGNKHFVPVSNYGAAYFANGLFIMKLNLHAVHLNGSINTSAAWKMKTTVRAHMLVQNQQFFCFFLRWEVSTRRLMASFLTWSYFPSWLLGKVRSKLGSRKHIFQGLSINSQKSLEQPPHRRATDSSRRWKADAPPLTRREERVLFRGSAAVYISAVFLSRTALQISPSSLVSVSLCDSFSAQACTRSLTCASSSISHRCTTQLI